MICVSVCEYMCIEIYILRNDIHGSSYGLRSTEISIRTHIINLNQFPLVQHIALFGTTYQKNRNSNRIPAEVVSEGHPQ
jgi:hypothetical protein